MKNCKNGGKTIIDLKDGSGSDPYRCECAHGYTGDLCEIGRHNISFLARGKKKSLGYKFWDSYLWDIGYFWNINMPSYAE